MILEMIESYKELSKKLRVSIEIKPISAFLAESIINVVSYYQWDPNYLCSRIYLRTPRHLQDSLLEHNGVFWPQSNIY